jgi:hypothetical protein
VQRRFEERLDKRLDALDDRLGRQLRELDASIRRAVDAVLGQRLNAFCKDQSVEHGSLEGSLRDVAAVVRRLEVKLDRHLAAPASSPKGRSGSGANGGQRERAASTMQRSALGTSCEAPGFRWGEEEGWGQGDDEGRRHSDWSDSGVRMSSSQRSRPLVNRERVKTESNSGFLLQGRERSRSFSDMIERVCGPRTEDWNPGRASDRGNGRGARSDIGLERQAKPGRLTAAEWQHPFDFEGHKASVKRLVEEPERSQDISTETPHWHETDGKAAVGEVGGKSQERSELEAAQQSVGSSKSVVPVLNVADGHVEIGLEAKLNALSDSLGKKLERIAYAVGIRNLNSVDRSAEDSEDRKRLMEKLKSAFDADRRRLSTGPTNEKDRWRGYTRDCISTVRAS